MGKEPGPAAFARDPGTKNGGESVHFRPFAIFRSKSRKFSVSASTNVLYGTKPPVFLLKKMGNFWAISHPKWGKNGEEMGKLFGVVYQPSDSEPITMIASLNRLTQYYITDNPHFKG